MINVCRVLIEARRLGWGDPSRAQDEMACDGGHSAYSNIAADLTHLASESATDSFRVRLGEPAPGE